MMEPFLGTTLELKKNSTTLKFENKRCYHPIPLFYIEKIHFVDTLSRRFFFGIQLSYRI